ncbi:aromatic acid exporter family protein [Cetobacterium sp. 2A]|uniref:aromatic acid exporter family protein n=1 Tax=unclassified Cetobacterium TaxID=2630983 RepID=UPI00163B8735|nr:aromatic acid exporter family protein [Cetobacterium sp. 2A]MBC2857328.1 aromatic acid exporter family protein [Cetobacterium sp. 2A]
MKYFDHRVIKTAFGAFIAVFIANHIGLKYGLTTAIVTIISIQASKKESLKIGIERFIACLIGLFISTLIFYIIGYTPIALGIFILVFMPMCLKLDLFQGFLVTVVLSTHILTEKSISLSLLINEVGILTLGIGIALILNLYMPNVIDEIKNTELDIDYFIKTILFDMSNDLKFNFVSVEENNLFQKLKQSIDSGSKLALIDYNNSFWGASTYQLELFNMKRNQYKVLKRMRLHFKRFYITYNQSLLISDFTKHVAETVGQEKLFNSIMIELQLLKNSFKEMELPKTREEFENRASLLQFINDLEEFIEIKAEFLRKKNCSHT